MLLQVVRVEAVASQAGPVDVSALSKPAQQSMEQQQAAKAARHGPQDAAARRAQATRWATHAVSCCLSATGHQPPVGALDIGLRSVHLDLGCPRLHVGYCW